MRQIEAACAYFEAGKLVDGVRSLQGVVNDADAAIARCADKRTKSAQRLVTLRTMAAEKVQEKL